MVIYSRSGLFVHILSKDLIVDWAKGLELNLGIDLFIIYSPSFDVVNFNDVRLVATLRTFMFSWGRGRC